MTKNKNYNVEDGKLYVCFETNDEGIRDFRNAPAAMTKGMKLGTMKVEGKRVPAIMLEVQEDSEDYKEYQREQWRKEDQWKRENRCQICGEMGKLIRCPMKKANPDYTGAPGEKKFIAIRCDDCLYGYHRLFRPVKGNVFFSTLDYTDDDGNTEAFEPDGGKLYSDADIFEKLTADFVAYLRAKGDEYQQKADLVEMLLQDYSIKDYAEKNGIAEPTVYGWRKKIRKVYNEFRETVEYI